jgi:hypothetical protein
MVVIYFSVEFFLKNVLDLFLTIFTLFLQFCISILVVETQPARDKTNINIIIQLLC